MEILDSRVGTTMPVNPSASAEIVEGILEPSRTNGFGSPAEPRSRVTVPAPDGALP
jgi:hypothetical protein